MATSRTKVQATADVSPSVSDPTVPDLVTVVIPKAFTLTLDDGSEVQYTAGTQEMPSDHANHWWSRAQGVTVYTAKEA